MLNKNTICAEPYLGTKPMYRKKRLCLQGEDTKMAAQQKCLQEHISVRKLVQSYYAMCRQVIFNENIFVNSVRMAQVFASNYDSDCFSHGMFFICLVFFFH